jgi:hypothetical protein
MMRRTVFAILLFSLTLSACSKSEDIIFGAEPLKQMAEKGDKFKKLSEEDRILLPNVAAYIRDSQPNSDTCGDSAGAAPNSRNGLSHFS